MSYKKSCKLPFGSTPFKLQVHIYSQATFFLLILIPYIVNIITKKNFLVKVWQSLTIELPNNRHNPASRANLFNLIDSPCHINTRNLKISYKRRCKPAFG